MKASSSNNVQWPLARSIQQLNRYLLRTSALGVMALAPLAQPVLAQEEFNAIEEIEVTGIRGALREALETKRDASSVIDSVSAEDIGKFPDKNIGDALQRMPGVTVERSYGEVSGVTVRGTAPEHSLVMLNGQNVASTGWFDLAGVDRSFNFELLSAEQISGMDLYKSTEAHLNEGAIGGTVNLHTRKPLELDAWTIYGSVEAAKNSLADDPTANASALVSWKNDSESFGILAGVSYEQQNVVRQELENIGVGTNPGSEGDDNIGPWGMGSRLFEEERERTSVQLTAQLAPTDTIDITLDYFQFGTQSDIINHNYLAIPSLNGVINDDTKIVNNQGATTYGEVTAQTADNGLVPLFYNPLVRKPEITSDVLNLTFGFQGQGWSTNIVGGASSSKSRTEQVSTWWGAYDNPDLTHFNYDNSGPHEITPINTSYVTTPGLHALHQEMTFEEIKRDQDISYLQADFTIEASLGAISSFDLGIKAQSNDFEASRDVMNPNLESMLANNYTLSDFDGGLVSGLHSESARAGTLTAYTTVSENIFETSKNARTSAVITDPWAIEEDTSAFYTKANFEGESYRGNVGLRLVNTDVVSKGLVDGQPDQGTQDYNNFLPSANLVFDLTDDLLLRFATGSTLARPNYDQMKMATEINVNFQTADIGSPDLKPYRSDNYDIGLEWYFSEGSVLGGTLFQKNISDYIEQTEAIESLDGCGEECRVTRYRNVGTANVSGLEMQYQQELASGFGFLANYTYTDSVVNKANGDEARMQGVSDNAFNASVYFENNYLSARLAYNYRSEWEAVGLSADRINDAYAQWDASVIWHATDYLDLSLEGVNLTNEAITSYNEDYGFFMNANEFGARYYLGASVKF